MEQAYSERFGRQRIIERPRLTRLLDESPSRILMLIAPAGYGKTILARQWLATRRHGWYRGTSGSADVAALAIGLSQASQPIVPGAGERMQERLRATGTPEEDVVALAELLAEDLQEWPEDAWLAFDDYQFACSSRFSERFVDLLLSLTRLRMLLTSRVRPSWATSRRLLYGEVQELGRTFLAMTDDEALEVLDDRDTTATGLVALAEGWPAVIGLASLTAGRQLPDEAVPAALYDYFAEELYQAAAPELQWRLSQLALVPSVTDGLAEAILGADAASTLAEGLELGFFTSPARGVYDTHRLLRTFLETKFREAPPIETARVARVLGHALADRELWDDALDLLERYFIETLFLELIELALPSVLRDGRLPTLDRWVDVGIEHAVDAAVLNLAEAESCFRKGERSRAQTLAHYAGKRMLETDPLRIRALLLAARSAHINGRHEEAFASNVVAYEQALSDADRWDALRGQVVAAIILERSDTEDILERLRQMNDGTLDRESELRTVEFNFKSRIGTVVGERQRLEEFMFFAPRVKNPVQRTNLYFQLVQAYLHEARYRDALKTIAQASPIASEHKLLFVRPYLTLTRARAELGLRNFARAMRLVESLQRNASPRDHAYVAVEALLLEARLYLSQGAAERAIRALDRVRQFSPPRGEYGESLVGRAAALACLADTARARELTAEALAHTRSLHVRAVSACVLAIAAIQDDASDKFEQAVAAVEVIRSCGEVDSLVAAYRSYPLLLEAPAATANLRDWLVEVMMNARDIQLAARFGLIDKPRIDLSREPLSPREREVLGLLAQGLTNRQIAKSLYISESTTKVHLRHIYEKLGVRSRLEAAMKATGGEI
jgi:LuxR family maltose regulon positive regulatory protein